MEKSGDGEMDAEFAGKTALVTGGAKGIGRACCVELARRGARVAVNYLTSGEAAAETVSTIESRGGHAIAIQADVSKEDDVAKLVAAVEDWGGPVDLLVNNAGVFDYVSHNETTTDLWRRTLDCNLTSAFLVTWAVKDRMIERRDGRIVNIASIAALRGRPMSIAYSVSKAGMVALTKSLADAVAEYGVRVNAVAPGLIETEIIAGVAPESIDALVQATPMKRLGQPEDISDVAAFLLSDRARFMTGQTVVASGGRVQLP